MTAGEKEERDMSSQASCCHMESTTPFVYIYVHLEVHPYVLGVIAMGTKLGIPSDLHTIMTL